MSNETKTEQAEVLAERFVETMKQLPSETLVRLYWIMKGIDISNGGKPDPREDARIPKAPRARVVRPREHG